MNYLMAIDAGTGTIRAAIFVTLGNQISVAQKECTHLEEEGGPNSMSFDFAANWLLVCECIRESLKSANLSGEDILALSATSMREGIVLYDKDGNELWAVANVDARADKEVRYLKENFKGIEEEFYKESGQTFALGAIPRILWLKNNRADIYYKVSKISIIFYFIFFFKVAHFCARSRVNICNRPKLSAHIVVKYDSLTHTRCTKS